MSEERNRGFIGVLVLIFLFFMAFMVFAVYTMRILSSSDQEGLSLDSSKVEEPIAVVEVNGVIMDSKEIIEKLHIAEEKKNVKAIIIRVNSPGGAVGPVQEVYNEIIRIDQEKPVFASFGSVAASGGYYIGAATRKIFANPGSLTGSIGVIMQFMDLSKLYAFAKVKPETIKAGLYKDAGNPSRGITEEERALYTKMLQGVRSQFIEDIARTRKAKVVGDLNNHAQGQIFSGKFAYEKGLVDELGSLWEAGRKIHKELELKGKFGFKFIKLKKDFSWADFLENIEGLSGAVKAKVQTPALPMFLLNKW